MSTTFNFNYQEILAKLVTILTGVYADKWPVVKDASIQYLTDAEERLSDLAKAYTTGDANKDFVLERLSEEKFLLWSQIRSFEVLAEATAEKLANDVIAEVLSIIHGLVPEN